MSDYSGAAQPDAGRARATAHTVADQVAALAWDYPGRDREEFRSWLLACSAAIRDFADQARPETGGAHRRPVSEHPARSVRRMRSNRGWQS